MLHLNELADKLSPFGSTILFAFVGTIIAFVSLRYYQSWKTTRLIPGVPVMTADGLSPLDSWQEDSIKLLHDGLERDGPYQVMTGTGPFMVLKNRYADEIKDNKAFSITESMKSNLFVKYPGFQPLDVATAHADLIRDTISMKLTGALAAVMADIVDETDASISDNLGDDEDWKSISMQPEISRLVTRISARAFVGLPLCRDQTFIEVENSYVTHVMEAVTEMTRIPAPIRPVMYWFAPKCKILRESYKAASKVIRKELDRRADAAKKALAEGKKLKKSNDAIAWFLETAAQRHHAIANRSDIMIGFQLSLSGAAIHTTTHSTVQVLTYLIRYPEYIAPLREEIISVLGNNGWERNSVHNLKFMDSLIKEVQRLTHKVVMLRRTAVEDIFLSDGLKVPKGTKIQIESQHFDPETYPEPLKFDPYRFYRKRDDADGMKWHLVSCTPELMGFGLGPRACPGRFFAANEIKVLLSFLLLRYDIDMDPEFGLPKHIANDGFEQINPEARLRLRRRVEEVDLTAIKN